MPADPLFRLQPHPLTIAAAVLATAAVPGTALAQAMGAARLPAGAPLPEGPSAAVPENSPALVASPELTSFRSIGHRDSHQPAGPGNRGGHIMEETMFDFAVLVWLALAALPLAADIITVGARSRVRNPVLARAATRTRPRSLRRGDK
ncbi:hypothetical protein IC232_24970 [Microvirga sp. BT688]|uniref:hypothetical protein n=1 Tax=Microvirga sp. TaxID=1873136 RepID=UPI001684A5A7|nr:hypothetical protein [Microvirga sp.]MBD2749929.1 hypothetical protein [Microvirga sp.]